MGVCCPKPNSIEKDLVEPKKKEIKTNIPDGGNSNSSNPGISYNAPNDKRLTIIEE